jgi:hypothetical protein
MVKYYRARGVYKGTGKEGYLTTVWRSSHAEAKSDAKAFGGRWDKVRVTSKSQKSFVDEINSGKRKRLARIR